MTETNNIKETKTQLLKKLQKVVDNFNEKKRIVEIMLNEIDVLENEYKSLVKEIKNNK